MKTGNGKANEPYSGVATVFFLRLYTCHRKHRKIVVQLYI